MSNVCEAQGCDNEFGDGGINHVELIDCNSLCIWKRCVCGECVKKIENIILVEEKQNE